ncbi:MULTISPECIES: GNAT family N-acetyltransferase [Devosia]|uniref:GNAT family N-acetyltransferase n=1 Tax=Devosia TaxID=46913 RepID=UPI000CE94C52|nr:MULTISPECIES: GNAT family N-acetyltransferase [Devosia]AVF02930.1 hypothetical protein C4375_03720 [Devosia sp. I507]
MAIKVGTPSEVGVTESRVELFFEHHWPRRISLADHAFAHWQFALAPDTGANHSIIAFDQGENRIAGVMGLTPRPFYLSESALNGAELTTWVVAENYRNSGAGAKILSAVMERYDALIGMGISAQALPIYLRSGFRYLRAIPRYVKILNLDNSARVGEITPVGRKLQRISGPDAPPYQVSGEVSPELFVRLTKSLNMFDRGPRYLEWRYRNHPRFKYDVFSVRSGGGEALVVTRTEDGLGTIKVLHVLDCVGDESAMPAAVAFIEERGRSLDVDFCDYYSTAASLNRFFIASGWHSTVDDVDVQLPHLFHPVEMRSPPTTSLIYWARDRMTEMADLGRLYISKQDADLDRPMPL